MKQKVFTIILLTISIVLYSNISRSQVHIANVECAYSLCDIKANVILDNVGSGLENLKYYIRDNSTWSWSSSQSSSLFVVEKGKNYTIWVQDDGVGTHNTYDFTVENRDVSDLLDGDITHIDCDHNKGEIDLSLLGGDRYITLTKNDNIVFTQPVLNSSIRDFTVEIQVRLDDTSTELANRGTVGLIGQDNTLEFGFRQGAPSFYLYTNRGAVDHQTSTKKIDDDNQWHQLVVRGNGSKVEMLVDGNVWFLKNFTTPYTALKADGSGVFQPISIGQKVWGSTAGKGINGDVGRATYWKRCLSNTELSQLRQGILAPETDNDCLAAYSLHEKEAGKLPALKGEDGTFSSTNIQWSNLYTCTWRNSSGAVISTSDDLINVDPGHYFVSVVYDPRDCALDPLNKEYVITNKKNLSTSIIGEDRICEGDQYSITTIPSGGSILSTTKYTYQWQEYKTNSWQNILGAVSNKYTGQTNILDTHRYRVVVKSGLCNVNSVEKQVNIEQKIKTQPIVR